MEAREETGVTTIHVVNNYLAEDLIACCMQTASGCRRFDEEALARSRYHPRRAGRRFWNQGGAAI